MTEDPHGQPYNVRFNRARRAERDLSELLGLAKGVLADGVVTEDEASALRHWVETHPDAVEQWPVNVIAERLEKIFSDSHVDDGERMELQEILTSLVGGIAGVLLGEDTSASLPLDAPPPEFVLNGSVFVLTGKFAYGTRDGCERDLTKLGAICERGITRRTRYLVIGTFGSRDWIHTSFGRKIEKAVALRQAGVPLAIVCEDHWVRSIFK